MGNKSHLLDLIKSHKTPHEIAYGVAIGVFIGIMPLYGLHLFLVLLVALLIPDINKISIFIGSSISIPPTIPLITWAAYNIGRLMLGNKCASLTWSMLKGLRYKNLLDIYYPLFLGSIVLGIICAVIFYFITLTAVEKMQRK